MRCLPATEDDKGFVKNLNREVYEPVDEDVASFFGEFIFELPDGLVDLKAITDEFLNSFNLDIRESLPIEVKPGIYQRSYLASEHGKAHVHRLDVIAFREGPRQRILLMAALPDKHEAMGGRNSLLQVFSDGASFDALVRDVAERGALLEETPDTHVVATSSGGVALTQADFRLEIAFAEFLAGRKMSGDDIRWLLSTIDDEREKSPNLEDYDQVRTVLEQARQAAPQKRLQMAIALYANVIKTLRESGNESKVMDLVDKLNPVLAESNGDIQTERALEARLRSARTVMLLQGSSADEIDSALPRLRQDIVSSFDQVSDAERKALQAAEARWWNLQLSMNASTPEQRLAKLNQAAERAGTNLSIATTAHALEEGINHAELMAEYREHLSQVLELLFEAQRGAGAVDALGRK